jgi:hypothetical protein
MRIDLNLSLKYKYLLWRIEHKKNIFHKKIQLIKEKQVLIIEYIWAWSTNLVSQHSFVYVTSTAYQKNVTFFTSCTLYMMLLASTDGTRLTLTYCTFPLSSCSSFFPFVLFLSLYIYGVAQSGRRVRLFFNHLTSIMHQNDMIFLPVIVLM